MADKMEEDIPQEEQIDEMDLSKPQAVTAYKTAAEIANEALKAVMKACQPGTKILDLCILGDNLIEEACNKIKKKKDKGIAFPTSISINHCVGHFSPLREEEGKALISEGDLVKIDLGVQYDGLISVVAHTMIATSSSEATTGRKADVICAAHFAAEAAYRLLQPGRKNTEITDAINKIAQQFKCSVVEGVLSHEMKRFVIDGNKVILSKETSDQKVEEFEFEENQVYGVDIVISTGEGKTKETETRPTIFKRAVDQSYLLKLKASRYVFSEVNKKYPTLPFNLRFLDEKRAKLGIVEMLKHDLVTPYPVLYEKNGEYVAQFKFTALILPSSTQRLNSHELPHVSSEYKIEDPEILKILSLSTSRSKKKKKTSETQSKEAIPATKEKDQMETD